MEYVYSFIAPPGIEARELSRAEGITKLAEGINASLIVRSFFEGYTRHFRHLS